MALGRRTRRGPGSEAEQGHDGKPAKERTPEEQTQYARNVCLNMLSAQARTRQELAKGLARRGVTEEIANRVLDGLDEVGLIDDAAFAELWVHSRHTYQGLGRRALASELRRKGVDNDVVADAVSTVDSEAEEERARELVRKQLRTTSLSRVDELTKIRRLVGMLARKGYSEGMAFRVVREELRAAGEDVNDLDLHSPD